MSALLFITHPEVVVDPDVAMERWHLSANGIDRRRAFSKARVVSGVRAIWSSGETKAIEAAGILAAVIGIGINVFPELGENDRSSTGFLPPAEFERTADAFFAEPENSVRGWERAVDAQTRIRAAVTRIVSQHQGGDVAIIAHGAVGTLLYCALSGIAISRTSDQPFQGHFWTADLSDMRPARGWEPIAPRK